MTCEELLHVRSMEPNGLPPATKKWDAHIIDHVSVREGVPGPWMHLESVKKNFQFSRSPNVILVREGDDIAPTELNRFLEVPRGAEIRLVYI
jgi:hypothetical protein